ncbi:MAG: 4Fe-4S binding protein [Deltaproteobacteria bacterium]|jgi:Pyruvate/2-oxoacid:ferredoxin oxidoreductase delta subunit/Fe-S cluster assembly iron-binding protein IscA|nr:4Fe-4S binding protein [Deltaproteobacteria bacterium]
MKIDRNKCRGCRWCADDCPVSAIAIEDEKAALDDHLCVDCGLCLKVCRFEAVVFEHADDQAKLTCDHCPIKCRIGDGFLGACRRYKNDGGCLERLDKPLTTADVRPFLNPPPKSALREPLITAIGVGTTYPDSRPAPAIVQSDSHGLEVVTVATEVPLSYSSVMVKVDTDRRLGRPGSAIVFDGREVGMLETEQYGSKMLHIGGADRLTADGSGFATARAVTQIANRGRVKLKIKNGADLEVQVGQAPVVDGRPAGLMKVGCGSAVIGMFASILVEAADEVLVLDSHVTGQLSRHVAGLAVGAKPSGVELVFPMSTPGRHFGDHGPGWGGTSITDPASLVKRVDLKIARPGRTVLITDTTGLNGAMYKVTSDGRLAPIELTKKAKNALRAITENCEPSLVSAIYTGGSGGSARIGVCRSPLKMTRAVHQNKVVVTIGGASAYVLPGGGINFLVDVGQVKPGSFYWTPTPATICPLEYTMELKDYQEMGGHLEAIKPLRPPQS